MLVQAPVMLLTSGGSMGLLPLGLALFAVLALPAIAVAKGAAVMRGRRSHGNRNLFWTLTSWFSSICAMAARAWSRRRSR